jgi:hypothetical protein
MYTPRVTVRRTIEGESHIDDFGQFIRLYMLISIAEKTLTVATSLTILVTLDFRAYVDFAQISFGSKR